MKALLLTFALAQGANMTTTVMGLRAGCEERNPLYGRRVDATRVIVAKGVSTLLIGTIAWGAHKSGRTKAAKVILWAGIAAGAGATVWDIHQLPKC